MIKDKFMLRLVLRLKKSIQMSKHQINEVRDSFSFHWLVNVGILVKYKTKHNCIKVHDKFDLDLSYNIYPLRILMAL